MKLTLSEAVGGRVYLVGETYPHRETLRAGGARWDPERRAWWVSDRARAEALAQQCGTGGAGATGAAVDTGGAGAGGAAVDDPTGTTVAARGRYRDRPCYVVGRVVRGRTHWDDRVAPVRSRDGASVLCCSPDGTRRWWATASEVVIARQYERPTTISALRRYAARQREAERDGRCACSCHGGPQCTCPRFCTLHHDGCDRCGCEA